MEAVAILCTTFLAVLVAYWIMPTKKMKAINRELRSLLQVLPISKIIESINRKDDKPPDKGT